jgi:hypothetical protein
MADIVRRVGRQPLLSMILLRHHYEPMLQRIGLHLYNQIFDIYFMFGSIVIVGSDIVDGCGGIVGVICIVGHPKYSIIFGVVVF